MRSLFTCRGGNEVVLCCRGELRVEAECEEDVSESLPTARTISLSLISLAFHLLP